MGMNMKLLISTVDPLAAGAPLVVALAVAGVEAGGELAPPLFELELHAVAIADTAITATTTKNPRRGRLGDLGDVFARFMSAPFSGQSGRVTRGRQANLTGGLSPVISSLGAGHRVRPSILIVNGNMRRR
jgi:hypothetical protein